MVFDPMEQEKMPGEIVVEEIIRNYPALLSLHREGQNTSVTVGYSERVSGKGGRKDPTAIAALRELPEKAQHAYEAIRKTISETHRHTDGLLRLKVIDLVYWKRTHTLAEAAADTHCSLYAVQTYQNDFIQSVKKNMEISDCDGCRYYRLLYNDRACHYCLDEGKLRTEATCLAAQVRYQVCPYYKGVS